VGAIGVKKNSEIGGEGNSGLGIEQSSVGKVNR